MTSETVKIMSTSSFNHKINKLQQSTLYKRLMQNPSRWIEIDNEKDINLAYELETYGLANVNSTAHKKEDSVKVKITHS